MTHGDKLLRRIIEVGHYLMDQDKAKTRDPDYTTDTALHPFVGKGALCERCGEARDWHKEEPK